MAQASFLDALKSYVPSSWAELKSVRWFTFSNYTNLAMLAFFVAVAIYQAKQGRDAAKKLPLHSALKAPGFPPITGLEKFDWKTAEPVKLRPFKTESRSSTAFHPFEPSSLLLMDQTYQTRLTHRRTTLQQHANLSLGIHDEPRIRPAVSELYTFIMGTYLPLRYPTMFRLHYTDYEYGKETVLQNLVTGEIIPTKPNTTNSGTVSTERFLTNLGRHLDEDFWLLLPEKGGAVAAGDGKGGMRYMPEACVVCCCPWEVSPVEKLGRRWGDESGDDGEFAEVEVGKFVKRVTWSVTRSGELFQPGRRPGQAGEEDQADQFTGDFEPDNTFVRCERQTLYRLPKSKAIVFASRTYLYPIREIKEEGLGEELAQAIEERNHGNESNIYGAEVGSAIKKYLLT